MLCETYSATEFFPQGSVPGSHAMLKSYCRKGIGVKRMPAVIICPGGGYAVKSAVEGEPVALSFLGRGVQAFVLDYSITPFRYPQQLLELAAAVSFVREKANVFHVDPDKIAVCGFSAGGHLAGCLANLWHTEFLQEALLLPNDAYRPNAAVLGYPVITGRYGGISHENLCVTEASHPELSLERSVTENTPPCFIWHTANDPVVPVSHSLLMAEALHRAGRPFELHVFRNGPHVMSTATVHSAISPEHVDPHVAKWLGLCARWLSEAM